MYLIVNIKIKCCVLVFLFPQSTRVEYLKICEVREIKFFCRDFVEKSEFMFMMATFGVILILISLVKTIYLSLFNNLCKIILDQDLFPQNSRHYIIFNDNFQN